MITLLPISQPDYEIFIRDSIRDYAADKVQSGNWRTEEALERSRNEHEKLLPDGRTTKEHFIYTIFDEETRQNLGLLWMHITMEAPHREAFIFNFVIDEPFRGKGFGKQALIALDEIMQGMGVESIALHVFGFNTNAIGLYKKSGYEVTDLNMRKAYSPSAVE